MQYTLDNLGAVVASSTSLPNSLKQSILNWPQGAKVLDVGAGTGRLAKFVSIHRPDVVLYGVDSNDEPIQKHLKSLYQKYIIGDFVTLAFNDQYDIIVAKNVCHEICSSPDALARQKTFEQISRKFAQLLKPGGSLLLFDGVLPVDGTMALNLQAKSPTAETILQKMRHEFDAAPVTLSATGPASYSTDAATVFALLTKYRYVTDKASWRGERHQLYTFIQLATMKKILENTGLTIKKVEFPPSQVSVNFTRLFKVTGAGWSSPTLRQFRCLLEARKPSSR